MIMVLGKILGVGLMIFLMKQLTKTLMKMCWEGVREDGNERSWEDFEDAAGYAGTTTMFPEISLFRWLHI